MDEQRHKQTEKLVDTGDECCNAVLNQMGIMIGSSPMAGHIWYWYFNGGILWLGKKNVDPRFNQEPDRPALDSEIKMFNWLWSKRND